MSSHISVPQPDADTTHSFLLDEVHIVEIASLGIVTTIAADMLGLTGLDMLLAVFFSTTLAGQFLTSFLGRMRGS